MVLYKNFVVISIQGSYYENFVVISRQGSYYDKLTPEYVSE
jgi:hypothetical protein